MLACWAPSLLCLFFLLSAFLCIVNNDNNTNSKNNNNDNDNDVVVVVVVVAVAVAVAVAVVVVVVVVAATVQTAANSVELSNRLWALNFFSRGPYQVSLQP